MVTTPPPVLDEEEVIGNPLIQWLFFGGLIVLPVLCLAVLTLTSANVLLGRQLGVNLADDSALVVYDAVCTNTALNRILHVTFWTQDSAPITVRFGELETPVMTVTAGVNTLDMTIRSEAACPKFVTVLDQSRNRRAGGAVEIIEP
jgi:hypothetical protein